MPYAKPTIFVPYHDVDSLTQRGLRADQPPASEVTPGTLYFVADEGVTERSDGTLWEAYSGAGGGGAPAPHAPTHLAGGSDPLPWVDLPESLPANPPADVARLHALDVNGFTQVEMRDSAARAVRFASDNVLIAKVTDPAGVGRGQCVYLAGASGANPLVRLARADDIATMPTIGLALDGGVLNAFIRVLLSGTLQRLDTSAFAEGASLFVSPITAGALTTTLPVAPAFAQRVGFVTRTHATAGEMLVLTTGVVTPPRLHAATHAPGGSDPLANAAWTNQANAFTENQTIQRVSPMLYLFNDAGPVDQRRWRVIGSGPQCYLQLLNDNATAVVATALTASPQGDVSIGRDLYEKGRNTPLGHVTRWIPSVSVFGGGATVTVTGNFCTYAVIGNTLHYSVFVSGSVTPGVNNWLQISSPPGFDMVASWAGLFLSTMRINVPGVGYEAGVMQPYTGGVILLGRLGGSSFGAGNFDLAGTGWYTLMNPL